MKLTVRFKDGHVLHVPSMSGEPEDWVEGLTVQRRENPGADMLVIHDLSGSIILVRNAEIQYLNFESNQTNREN